jgi:23S rRNA pseudouridine2604 synthase
MDPDFYHEKEYLVEVTFPLNHRIIEALKKPIEIYGQKTRPPIIVQKSSKKFLITLTEGKNRQIRKICEAVGLRISFLHRVRIVNLQIANLEAGQLKKLNQREVERLKKDLEIKEFEFEYF